MYEYNSPLQNKQEVINQARQLYAGQRLTPQNQNLRTQEDIQIINNNKTQQNQGHYESPLRRSSHQKFNPYQYMNDGETSSTNNKYEDKNSNSKNMLLNKDALNNLNLKRNSQNNILFSTNINNINNRKNSLLNRVRKPSEKLNQFDSLQKIKMPSDSESHNRNCSSQSNQHNYSSQDTQKNNIEALEDIISQKSGQQSPLKKRNMSLNRLIIPQKILYDSDNNNNQNNFNNNKGISMTDRQSIDKMLLQADEEIQKNRKRKSKSRQFSKEISNFNQLPNTARSLQTEENNTNSNNNSIKFDKSEVFNSQYLSPTKNNSNSLQGSIKKEKQYNFSTNFNSARQTQEQQQQLQSKENNQMQNFSSYFLQQQQQNKSNQNSYMNAKEFLSPVNNRQSFNSNLDNGNSLMHKRNSSTNQFSLNVDNNNINERLNSLNLLKNNQENQSLLLNRLDQRSEKFIRSRVQFTDSNQNKQNSFLQNSYLNNNSNNKNNINFVNTEESLSMSPLRRSPMREKSLQQLKADTQQDSDLINTEQRDQSPRKQSDRDKFLKQIKKNQEFEGFSPLIQRKRISVESQQMLQKEVPANQNIKKINKTSQIKNTEHNNSNSNLNQENKNQNQNSQQQQQFELQNNIKINKKTSTKNSNSSTQNNNIDKTGLDEEKQTTKIKINIFNEKNQSENQPIKQQQQNNINSINKQHFVSLETHDIKQNDNINDEQEKQGQNQKQDQNTETSKNQTEDKQKKIQVNLMRIRQKKRISFNDIIQNNSNSNSKLSLMKKENSMDTINAINNSIKLIQNNRANTSPEKQVKGILKAQSKYSDQQNNSKDLGAQFQSREQNIVKNKRKRKSKQVQFNSEQIIFDCKDEQKK